MADQPISQEIKLPVESDQVGAAVKKLDELIGRVNKLEHANASSHTKAKEHEAGFKSLWSTMGRVLRREAELAVGIRAIGVAGLEAKGRVGEFLEFIGAEAALEGLKEIAEKVIDIGEEAVKSAALAERMNFALDAASGGKEAGENVRKFVEANAKFSEFTEEQNERAFLQLRRYGVGNQKAGLFMKASEDLAAVSAPQDRESVYQESLQAFARVHARGKIDTRSAMRLGIGVEDFATLPQFQGQNNKQIQKALAGGKANVTENDLLNLIVKHTGEKAIGERAADASQLLLTKMSKLSELPERFYKRLGETGTVKKLASEIDVILDKLDPESPIGKRIFGALESTFTTIVDAVGEIDFESVADAITNDVLPAIREMVSLIGPTLHAIETTIHGFGVAAHFITGRKTAKEHAEAEMAQQQNQIQASTGGFFSRVAAQLKAPFLSAEAGEKPRDSSASLPYGLPASAYQAGGSHAAGFAGGIDDGSGTSEAAASSMGEASHAALMSSIDAHSPSRKTMEAGGHFGEGYALGIEGKMGRIEDAIDSTMGAPSARGTTSVAGLGRGITATFGDINITVGGGQGNAETAGAILDELRKSIKPMFVDMFDEIDAEGTA